MNGRTFGILLGLVVLGIAFAGGASAAEDLTETPADAPITADSPITVDAPITTGSPITSVEETPLSGCCCCEWRYNPALDVLSEIRAY
jgi:hypothetical protein